MHDVVYFFREGGWGMYVILLLAVGAVTSSIAYAVGQRALRPVAAGLLAVTLVAGIVLTQMARGRVEDAVGGIEPGPQKQEILEVGKREANRNLELALGGVVAAIVPFFAGELKRRREEG